MTWQDGVLSLCGLFFAAALVPAIRGTDKPDHNSCLMTAGLLGVMVFTFCTLGLWVTAAANVVATSAWAILWWQTR